MAKNNNVVIIAAVIVVLAFAAPYFSGTSFAVARNTQDFAVTSVALPAFITKDLGFNVQATFANRGDVSGSHVVYSYEISNKYNRVYYAEGSTDLFAGQSRAVTLIVDDELAAGAYTLTVRADSDNAYSESDESNNAYSVTFNVPYP